MPNMLWIHAYARKLGVNLDDLLISQPDSGEQALEITDVLVRSGALDVVVVDSVGGSLCLRREIDGGYGRAADGPPGALDVPGDAQADRHCPQNQNVRHFH